MKKKRSHKALQLQYGALLLISVLALESLRAQAPSPQLQTFLRQQLQFTDQSVDDLRKGKPVAKILLSEKQEVAVFGIVLVRVPADFFVDRFRDIESYKKALPFQK